MKIKITFIGACLVAAGNGMAAPLNPVVVNGQVSFAQQGNQLTITNSPNAIINWSSFSVAQGEMVRFLQQSGNSSVLNRITGQDPSVILGTLQSNGRVFLINPNGILFGANSQINVGGLVASTLATSGITCGQPVSGNGAGRWGESLVWLFLLVALSRRLLPGWCRC